MLITVLKRCGWAFARHRLWLTVPLILGGIAMATGVTLLAPFIYGYDTLPSLVLTSVSPCAKEGRVYVVALSPTRFVIAITPNRDEVTVDDTGRFLSVARNLRGKGDPPMVYGTDYCKTWDFGVSADADIQVELSGAYVGSLFLSQINGLVFGQAHRQRLGYAPLETGTVGTQVEYQRYLDMDLRFKAQRKSLEIEGESVAVVYEGISTIETFSRGSAKGPAKSYRLEALPQKVLVPAGNMSSERIDFENPKPPVPVDVGITGAVFVVECWRCSSRAGYGTRLGITLNQWTDWDFGAISGDREGNRLVAATTSTWTAIPDPEFHAKREQVGKHWWSLGSPYSETSSFADHDAETTDVFRWERRDWLDREQAITLFASLLLGLGVTLWTELLIVFLHSISAPRE